MSKTFFQAIDDGRTEVRGLTFQLWVEQAKVHFVQMMGTTTRPYNHELLCAFYPDGRIDGVVTLWEGGMSPQDYASHRKFAARPPADML